MSPDKNIEAHRTDWGTVYEGDCLDTLRTLDRESLSLGFTSPPYFDAINYEGHVEKMKGETDWWEREEISYEEYAEFLCERFDELFRVTKPGRYNIVNLSPVISDEGRVPLPFHFVGWMEDQGWDFVKNIIWEKPVAVDRRSGVLMQHPYPGYYYPSIVSEYVLVFQKPGETATTIETDDMWNIRPVAPNEVEHPAPFPKSLARKVIDVFSDEGDTVIDIFGGSGQTYLAAQEANREFIGCEVLEEYVEYSIERLEENSSYAEQQKLDEVR